MWSICVSSAPSIAVTQEALIPPAGQTTQGIPEPTRSEMSGFSCNAGVVSLKYCITELRLFFPEEKFLLPNQYCPCKYYSNFFQVAAQRSRSSYPEIWWLRWLLFKQEKYPGSASRLVILPVTKEIWWYFNA